MNLVFVNTINAPEGRTFYAYRDSQDNAKILPIRIQIPDFEQSLGVEEDKLHSKGNKFIITHITKGKCKYDAY